MDADIIYTYKRGAGWVAGYNKQPPVFHAMDFSEIETRILERLRNTIRPAGLPRWLFEGV